MTQKRSGKSRRAPAKKKKSGGRGVSPAALYFFAGVAVAVVILFFVYAFYYLPGQKQAKPVVQEKPAVQAPASPTPATPPATPQAPTAAPAPPTPGAPGQQPATAPPQPGTPAAPEPAKPEPATAGPEAPKPAEPKPGGPVLTIVIDDLGGALEQGRDLLDLNVPLTFSILPNLNHTRDLDAMAAKAGMEVILHQPMQAHGKNPESPGTMHVGESVPETSRILSANLEQVPHATGISNHTGSRATEDPVLMASVMTLLKARGLFFLDSLTSPKSVAYKQASAQGVPNLSRTVFLDNERGQQAALLMLAQAEKEARTKGKAVAIGHPHPETIAALATWVMNRDKGITLVTLGHQLKGN